MDTGSLVAWIAATLFGDILFLVRHVIISIPRSQGDTKAGPNPKAVLFRWIKSINATMLKVDCGVVPLEGNFTKVKKEGVACDKSN